MAISATRRQPDEEKAAPGRAASPRNFEVRNSQENSCIDAGIQQQRTIDLLAEADRLRERAAGLTARAIAVQLAAKAMSYRVDAQGLTGASEHAALALAAHYGRAAA